MNKPMGVAAWETQLTQILPDNLQASLPTVEELEAELGVQWHYLKLQHILQAFSQLSFSA